jgi:hypothetical protein
LLQTGRWRNSPFSRPEFLTRPRHNGRGKLLKRSVFAEKKMIFGVVSGSEITPERNNFKINLCIPAY